MSRPLLSVIIPCYNAARFLPEAVATVRAQRYEPLEIFVIDDGSTDATPEIAPGLGPEVRYLRQENRGPSAARNVALRQARGEIIAFLDADDQWPEGRLDLQVGRLLEDPALDVVSGRVRYVELRGGQIPDLRFEGPDRTLPGIHIGAAVYRRRAFDVVGLFDETLRYSEDHDWFLRAREAGLKMLVLAEVTLLYRMHDANMTRDVPQRNLIPTLVIHKSLQRRRRKGGVATDLPPWSSYDEKRRTDE
ncbi:MAG: glycosyltransferase [Bryobacteraceae bacterium]|jgi:glycosyltransferase involved in cell wall biosynthesis